MLFLYQRQRMQKYTFCCSSDADKHVMWRSSSPPSCFSSFFQIVKFLALSTFVHSYATHFRVYLSQLEVERTDLSSLNHNFVLRH